MQTTSLASLVGVQEFFRVGQIGQRPANISFQQAIEQCHLNGLSYPCHQDAQAGYTLMRQMLSEQPSLSAVITINPWVIAGGHYALWALLSVIILLVVL